MRDKIYSYLMNLTLYSIKVIESEYSKKIFCDDEMLSLLLCWVEDQEKR